MWSTRPPGHAFTVNMIPAISLIGYPEINFNQKRTSAGKIQRLPKATGKGSERITEDSP
jgi:hypothetical protein